MFLSEMIKKHNEYLLQEVLATVVKDKIDKRVWLTFFLTK